MVLTQVSISFLLGTESHLQEEKESNESKISSKISFKRDPGVLTRIELTLVKKAIKQGTTSLAMYSTKSFTSFEKFKLTVYLKSETKFSKMAHKWGDELISFTSVSAWA